MGKTTPPNLTDEPKAGKKQKAKGAPKPRHTRGRTINRRRERAIRKAANAALNDDMTPEQRNGVNHQIELMKAAQARNIQRLLKK